MIVTTYSNLRDTRAVMSEVTWQEFTTHAVTTTCQYVANDEERGRVTPLYSPAELRPGSTRANENVLRLHFAPFDLDDRTDDEIVQIIQGLREKKLAFFLHTTFSHAMDQLQYAADVQAWEQGGRIGSAPIRKNRVRVLVPFSRPVPVAHWKQTWRKLNQVFALGANDKQVNDASRMYFTFCAPTGTPPDVPFTMSEEGGPIDVDALELEESKHIQLPGETVSIQALVEKIEELKGKQKHSKFRKLLIKLRAGDSFAGEHERHNTALHLTMWMVAAWPDASADSLAALFIPSLQLMAREGAEIDYEEVHAMIVGAQQKREESRIAHENEAAVKVQSSIAAVMRGRTTPYTYQELSRFAREAGVTLERFRNHWIVQYGDFYYLFVDGEYVARGYSKNELVTAARDQLAPATSAGVELMRMTEKGQFVPKNLVELAHDYGLVAKTIGLDMTRQRSTFDPTTSRLTLAVCPRQPLEPKYSPEVDAWFRVLAGVKYPKLVDWTASAGRLDEALAGLFFQGTEGVGKTLFANGISRIWGEDGPVKLKAAIDSNFNSDMKRNPIIFGDEQIPKDFRGRAKTSELREIITEPNHRYMQKHRDDTVLKGFPRLILAANNTDMLRSTETLTHDDIEAIAKRILTIDVTEEARVYMEAMPREKRIELFLAIAPHALWLEANHVVTRGKRFLVDGDEEAAKAMVTSAGLRGPVLHWCAEYLLRPEMLDKAQVGKYRAKLVRVYQGKLYVSSPAMLSHWATYETNRRPPELRELSQALKGVSEKRRVQLRAGARRPEYWVIQSDYIRQWVSDNGFCSVEEVDEALLRKDAEEIAEAAGVGFSYAN